MYVAAQDLLASFLKDVEWDEADIKVLGSCKGQDLELLNTRHPLVDRKSPIILGEHVTLDAGTGSVHTAPGHGLEDYEVGCRYGIEVFSPLDSRGVWTEAVKDKDLEGVPYYKGNSIVIEKLQNCGALLAQQDINHSYPHCWRCKILLFTELHHSGLLRLRNSESKLLKKLKSKMDSCKRRSKNFKHGCRTNRLVYFTPESMGCSNSGILLRRLRRSYRDR